MPDSQQAVPTEVPASRPSSDDRATAYSLNQRVDGVLRELGKCDDYAEPPLDPSTVVNVLQVAAENGLAPQQLTAIAAGMFRDNPELAVTAAELSQDSRLVEGAVVRALLDTIAVPDPQAIAGADRLDVAGALLRQAAETGTAADRDDHAAVMGLARTAKRLAGDTGRARSALATAADQTCGSTYLLLADAIHMLPFSSR